MKVLYYRSLKGLILEIQFWNVYFQQYSESPQEGLFKGVRKVLKREKKILQFRTACNCLNWVMEFAENKSYSEEIKVAISVWLYFVVLCMKTKNC